MLICLEEGNKEEEVEDTGRYRMMAGARCRKTQNVKHRFLPKEEQRECLPDLGV